MPFPLLALVPDLLKTVAKFVGGDDSSILGKAAAALENIAIPPEKQAEMQLALQKHEEAMESLSVEKMKAAVQESVAMIASPSKYVAWARPTMLYAATTITVYLAAVLGYVMLKHTPIDWGAVGAITSLTGPLFGAAGYYIGQRTKEKLNGNG